MLSSTYLNVWVRMRFSEWIVSNLTMMKRKGKTFKSNTSTNVQSKSSSITNQMIKSMCENKAWVFIIRYSNFTHD
ncbi:hypothetical protein KFK09_002217 [Dendrobium nobile]|uniref:Uncharacterized protein n=1 Tax=Dendrobium nobile TaxID=94219 RepID=A0A8T3BVA4_DENNO|nr:hypothetical protein KFK09_007058 [Dendrobium nobile]KAI0519608.1 hypothetical protein KFK09_007059 [Dendrobium nobile]KAI0529663.1 hypothetical protein KFK09_002217 [Dendrobium nobile]